MSTEAMIALSMITSASGFGGLVGRPPSTAQYNTRRSPFHDTYGPTTFLPNSDQRRKTSELAALIYGWDGEDDATYTDVLNEVSDIKTCGGVPASPEATAVAESITYNPDKVGHLARLAVAFSPPERALTLNNIENVEVLCVTDKTIEIEAVVCEDGGCVTLAVPVSFPHECGSEWLEGCVMRNLDELNSEAESLLLVQEEEAANEADLDELCMLNSKVDYPSWWVAPECNADLVEECDTIRLLLNKEEFQPDVRALAQGGLNALADGETYEIKKVVVSAVGPAGICFKVQAAFQSEDSNSTHILDVLVPFGGDPLQDAGSLRAAVLGVVAAAP